MKHALKCELHVLRFLLKQDYSLMYHRRKLFGVEVDLIVQDIQGRALLIEVKSNRSGWNLRERLNRKQLERLYRVYLNLVGDAGPRSNVQIKIAIVSHNGDIHFFALDELI